IHILDQQSNSREAIMLFKHLEYSNQNTDILFSLTEQLIETSAYSLQLANKNEEKNSNNQLTNQISRFEEKLETLNNQLNEHNNELNKLTQQSNELNQIVSRLESAINQEEQIKSELNNKIIDLISNFEIRNKEVSYLREEIERQKKKKKHFFNLF
ncbi:hypothetical protein, partial [Schinkia azotoformans]|uniref:hypothetical protein n=1 Tax=Schinkia azotoformans TaxID=1454 RepID=UPI0030C916A3